MRGKSSRFLTALPGAMYLFRGTTRDWPGNPVLEELGITPTTPDPLIATLFAIHCRNFGSAVVLVADGSIFPSGQANVLDEAEHAVNLRVTPEAFAERAQEILVEDSLRALAAIGFKDLPERLAHKNDLQVRLNEYNESGRILQVARIQEYLRRVTEASHDQ